MALAPWTGDDEKALVELLNEEEIAFWLDDLAQPYTLERATQLVALSQAAAADPSPDELYLKIAEATTGRPAGGCVVFHRAHEPGTVEVGYWLGADSRGRGYATDTVRLLAGWLLGDGSGVVRVELKTDPRNLASRAVAERVGFQLERLERASRTHGRTGELVDVAVYVLSRSEWAQL